MMSKEECGLLSLDDLSRSRRLMSHVHESVSGGHSELRMKNADADGQAYIALTLFVQRHWD